VPYFQSRDFGINRCQSRDPRTGPGIKNIQFYLVKFLRAIFYFFFTSFTAILNAVFDIKMDEVNVLHFHRYQTRPTLHHGNIVTSHHLVTVQRN
jgi:hypothetical protein